MASDAWREMRLGDFVTLQRGHDLPERDRVPGSVPILGSFGITGYHNKAIAPGPGVTVGRSGASYGVVSYSPVDYWPLNTALYVIKFHGNDPRFAYYFLRNLDFSGFNVGSAQPSLNRNHIHPIPVLIPSVSEQKAIARILGTLDNKIELNRRMNQTLEGLARAVFRSWFVDFDAVVAKAAGRRPLGMDAATAKLFPDSFADSPLGPIPKGWQIGKLGEIATINARSIKRGYPHSAIEYIDISSVTVGHLEGTTPYEMKNAPSRAQRLVSHGDTLWSCVRPNRKSYLFVYQPEPNVIASTGFAVLTSTAAAPCFLHLTVTTDEFVDYLESHAEGSAYPAVRPDSFAKADVLIPTKEILAAFDRQVSPLFDRRASNEKQSRTLADLRDALLPRLLSGELRVKQVERAVEEVV